MKRKIMIRFYLLAVFPFLPLFILIDIAIGDIVTGVKTAPKDKVTEQWEHYKECWRSV